MVQEETKGEVFLHELPETMPLSNITETSTHRKHVEMGEVGPEDLCGKHASRWLRGSREESEFNSLCTTKRKPQFLGKKTQTQSKNTEDLQITIITQVDSMFFILLVFHLLTPNWESSASDSGRIHLAKDLYL